MYNYREAVKEDVKNWMDEVVQEVIDELDF